MFVSVENQLISLTIKIINLLHHISCSLICIQSEKVKKAKRLRHHRYRNSKGDIASTIEQWSN